MTDLTGESDGEGDLDILDTPITLGEGVPMGLVTISDSDLAALREWVDIEGPQ